MVKAALNLKWSTNLLQYHIFQLCLVYYYHHNPQLSIYIFYFNRSTFHYRLYIQRHIFKSSFLKPIPMCLIINYIFHKILEIYFKEDCILLSHTLCFVYISCCVLFYVHSFVIIALYL